jgi:hypothetical protein
VARGQDEVNAAVEQPRGFLNGMIEKVGEVHKPDGTVKEAFEATHVPVAKNVKKYGSDQSNFLFFTIHADLIVLFVIKN